MLNNIPMLLEKLFRSNNHYVKIGTLPDPSEAMEILTDYTLNVDERLELLCSNYVNNTHYRDEVILNIIIDVLVALRYLGVVNTTDVITVDGLKYIKEQREKLIDELNRPFYEVDLRAFYKLLEFVSKTSAVDVNYYPEDSSNVLMTLNTYFNGGINFFRLKDSLLAIYQSDCPIKKMHVDVSTRCDWTIPEINKIIKATLRCALGLNDNAVSSIKSFRNILKLGYTEVSTTSFEALCR